MILASTFLEIRIYKICMHPDPETVKSIGYPITAYRNSCGNEGLPSLFWRPGEYFQLYMLFYMILKDQ